MVRKYVRKTQRQSWDIVAMENAVSAVANGEIGLKKASQQYDVPRSTLKRYVQKKRTQGEAFRINKTDGKFKKVFTAEQELELVEYLKTMESRLFGLTMCDFRRLAFQLAEQNGCSHNFNVTAQMAGPDWMENFFSRHPTLSLRKPEATSGARAMGFNRIAVTQFFTLLTETIDKYKLTGERIYNCDETGVQVNPKNQSKIIAKKGKRQVGALTSSERGETVTAEICFSAAGSFMPPMLIFPRKRRQPTFEIGLPPGSTIELSESGWITKELFLIWFQRFIEFSQASKEHPVLLILDGHSTHTKNLDLIKSARENGVILLCLPPHSSHKIQPLDVSFMKPLSTYYEHETRKWLRSNPSKVITLNQISSLFGAAYLEAARMKTAINGFRKTGIWPVDENVFSESDFMPSATSEIPIHVTADVDTEHPRVNNSDGNDIDHLVNYPQCLCDEPSTSKMQPRCKRHENISQNDNIKTNAQDSISEKIPESVNSSFDSKCPTDILPIPKVAESTKRVSRKRGKTAVLSSTPYKDELEQAISQQELTKRKKVQRRIESSPSRNPKSNEKNNSKEFKKRAGRVAKMKKIQKKKIVERSSSESEIDDAECLYCAEFYSQSTEGWVACSVCHKWAHNSCAGLDSDDDETVLICEICK